jgi:hypothetical protein
MLRLQNDASCSAADLRGIVGALALADPALPLNVYPLYVRESPACIVEEHATAQGQQFRNGAHCAGTRSSLVDTSEDLVGRELHRN